MICDNIVDIILGKRISLESDTLSDVKLLREILNGKVDYFVERNIPIEFSISAFSLKSQIPGKCISNLPDMAEYEALLSFDNLIKEIEKIYNVGARINIFADGRLFVGILYGFTDDLVTQYTDKLKDMTRLINDKDIHITTLEDVFGTDYLRARDALFLENQVDIKAMVEEMYKNEYSRNLFKCIRDFYAKDIRFPLGLSVKQSRVEGLKMAIGVLSTTRSWGNIIKETIDSNCIRLSCHPRPYTYEPGKIGIYMNNSGIKCGMPWHGVALKTSEGIVYKKLKDVLEMGAIFVENNRLPYYEIIS